MSEILVNEENFMPKEKAQVVDKLEKMQELLQTLNFTGITIKGNLLYSLEKLYVGMPLNKFHKHHHHHKHHENKNLKFEILEAFNENGLQLKISNIFDNSNNAHVYIPIAYHMIVEEFIETKKHKAIFFNVINFFDFTPGGEGTIKIHIA